MNCFRVQLALMAACLLVTGLASNDNSSRKTVVVMSDAAEHLFDPDPAHPWNRLHRHFYVRSVPGGGNYVHHGLDAPPIGADGSYLLEGETYEKTIQLLDDFLQGKADERIGDPLKRAVLQRDLWYVFETLERVMTFSPLPNNFEIDPKHLQRRAVERRLIQIMRRLEQSPEQLLKLPDNYSAMVKNKTFAARFDAEHPERPYLPVDLNLEGQGEWVAISRHFDDGPAVSAPNHQHVTQGRAVFLALLRLPGGRKQTEEYLLQWPKKTERDFNRYPPIPTGSQVALVRRMLLPDDHGGLSVTPITENVQLRVFSKKGEQQFFEFTLDREVLLSGKYDLHAVGPAEKELFGFGLQQRDERHLFDNELKAEPVMVLSNCVSCHGIPDQLSIHTFGFREHDYYAGTAQTDFSTQVRETVNRKTRSYSWGFLQGLREAVGP